MLSLRKAAKMVKNIKLFKSFCIYLLKIAFVFAVTPELFTGRGKKNRNFIFLLYIQVKCIVPLGTKSLSHLTSLVNIEITVHNVH